MTTASTSNYSHPAADTGLINVFLNVYDVTNTTSENGNLAITRLNNFTREICFGGIFHGAIEIGRYEWSFGYCEKGTGVYACHAKKNPMYQFRETINLGPSNLTSAEMKAIVDRLKVEWQGPGYELLSRNCCHFCEVLAQDLGVKPIPGWLNRFAIGADATVKFHTEVVNQTRMLTTMLSKSATQSMSWMRDTFTRVSTRPPSASSPSDTSTPRGSDVNDWLSTPLVDSDSQQSGEIGGSAGTGGSVQGNEARAPVTSRFAQQPVLHMQGADI